MSWAQLGWGGWQSSPIQFSRHQLSSFWVLRLLCWVETGEIFEGQGPGEGTDQQKLLNKSGCAKPACPPVEMSLPCLLCPTLGQAFVMLRLDCHLPCAVL